VTDVLKQEDVAHIHTFALLDNEVAEGYITPTPMGGVRNGDQDLSGR